jgi:tetratricopeptide (TPR) repeat protein
MKSLLTMLFILMLSISSFAQKSKVRTAWNALLDKDYASAKAAIDESVANTETKDFNKAWYYRGLIYQAINQENKAAELNVNAMDTAVAAYKKCILLNDKSEFVEDCIKNLLGLGVEYSNKAIVFYNDAKYAESFENFKNKLAINDFTATYNLLAQTDTQTIFNTALLGQKLGKTQEAIGYYEQLIKLQYYDAYSPLARLYKQQKDTTKSLEVLQQGLTKFPNDKQLINDEINTLLVQGKLTTAIARLNDLIKLDPSNTDIYYILGNANDNQGKLAEAREAYKKALEINPAHFDTNLAMGVSHFNEGVIINDQIRKLGASSADMAKSTSLEKQRNEIFEIALPYLEKAITIGSTNTSSLEQANYLAKKIKAITGK